MVRIEFDRVNLAYREVLFRDFTRQIAGGKITAVTGPNGSGKSTLLRLAAGLIAPDSGTVTMCADGAALKGAARQAKIAMLTPEMNPYPRLTARENLAFLLGLRGVRLTEALYTELLARVGLAADKIAGIYTGEFSTGMRQRLKLAAVIGTGAPVWLLDEPGLSLDAAGRALVLREARRAADSGALVMLATNDRAEEVAADDCIEIGATGIS